MERIEKIASELEITESSDYKITFMLDKKAMISVNTVQYGDVGMDNYNKLW